MDLWFPNSRRAATLAEVLVALAVFSIFALAILSTLSQAGRLNRKDREVSQATQLANCALEQCRLEAADPAGFDALEAQSGIKIPETSYRYDREVVVLSPGLKKVTVRLQGASSMTLSTVVSRP